VPECAAKEKPRSVNSFSISLLVIAVEFGFRLAVRSGAAGSRPPRTSRRFPRRRVLPGKPFASAPGSTGINDTQPNSLINQAPCCEVIFLRPA
jgi:hypothetical protein